MNERKNWHQDAMKGNKILYRSERLRTRYAEKKITRTKKQKRKIFNH